ncbi:hemopexin domain protein [Ceratobasidium sp. AG-Ba]|nr:hemopexin domain protein [Ceratobasidium sp. AG-Ba]
MVGRAAIKVYGSDQYFFFVGLNYVRINWAPGERDTIVHGPAPIISDWKSLSDAGFAKVDAILPIPDCVYEAYVFSGTQFCRIRYLVSGGDDELLAFPASITTHWPSLARAGFDHVDAAIIVPGTTNQAYFFSGTRFCRVSFHAESDQPGQLLQGPYEIRDRWGSLGFQTVDMVLPSPYTSLCTFTHAYVLSGALVAKINLVPGGDVDVIEGPANEMQVWPSLCSVFY